MFGLGWQELLLVLLIALLLFGPGKLPELGRSVGKAVSALKKGLREGEKDEGGPGPNP